MPFDGPAIVDVDAGLERVLAAASPVYSGARAKQIVGRAIFLDDDHDVPKRGWWLVGLSGRKRRA
jgi:hypothetical protein